MPIDSVDGKVDNRNTVYDHGHSVNATVVHCTSSQLSTEKHALHTTMLASVSLILKPDYKLPSRRVLRNRCSVATCIFSNPPTTMRYHDPRVSLNSCFAFPVPIVAPVPCYPCSCLGLYFSLPSYSCSNSCSIGKRGKLP